MYRYIDDKRQQDMMYYEAHRSEKIKYMRKYYKDNRERLLEQKREFVKKFKYQFAAYRHKRRFDNLEHHKELDRKSYQRNKKNKLAYMKAYYIRKKIFGMFKK